MHALKKKKKKENNKKVNIYKFVHVHTPTPDKHMCTLEHMNKKHSHTLTHNYKDKHKLIHTCTPINTHTHTLSYSVIYTHDIFTGKKLIFTIRDKKKGDNT